LKKKKHFKKQNKEFKKSIATKQNKTVKSINNKEIVKISTNIQTNIFNIFAIKHKNISTNLK